MPPMPASPRASFSGSTGSASTRRSAGRWDWMPTGRTSCGTSSAHSLGTVTRIRDSWSGTSRTGSVGSWRRNSFTSEDRTDAVAPSYRRDIVDFWLGQPKAALEGRRALHWMLDRAAPQLASIPHCEQRPQRWPRNWDALAVVAGYHWNRWTVRVGSRLGLDGHALQMRTYVWDLWHGTTAAQAHRQAVALHDDPERLRSVLGWALPPPSTRPWVHAAQRPHEQARLSRRLYLLHEYAGALQVSTETAERAAGPGDR